MQAPEIVSNLLFICSRNQWGSLAVKCTVSVADISWADMTKSLLPLQLYNFA